MSSPRHETRCKHWTPEAHGPCGACDGCLAPLLTMTEADFNPPPFADQPETAHLPKDPVMRSAYYANYADALRNEVLALRARLLGAEQQRDALKTERDQAYARMDEALSGCMTANFRALAVEQARETLRRELADVKAEFARFRKVEFDAS